MESQVAPLWRPDLECPEEALLERASGLEWPVGTPPAGAEAGNRLPPHVCRRAANPQRRALDPEVYSMRQDEALDRPGRHPDLPALPVKDGPVPARVPVGLVVAAIAGCASGDDMSSQAPPVAERDSAAVRIVESAAPAWDAGQGWRIAATPDVVIGASSNPLEGPDEIPLYRVQGARFLPDGGIVVANAGTSEVMVFDTAGSRSGWTSPPISTTPMRTPWPIRPRVPTPALSP